MVTRQDQIQQRKEIERELIIKQLESKTVKEREDLIEFMKYIFEHEKKKDFYPEKFHYLLADKLKQVLDWKNKRLMINIPPRHWKSELITKCFPVWALGNDPTLEIIMTSEFRIGADFRPLFLIKKSNLNENALAGCGGRVTSLQHTKGLNKMRRADLWPVRQ